MRDARGSFVLLGAAQVMFIAAITVIMQQRCSAAPLVPLPFLRGRVLPLAAVLTCAAAMATTFFLLSLYL